jgi:hypothetical protein
MSIRIPSLRAQQVDAARHVASVRAEMAVLTQRLGITPKKSKLGDVTLEDNEEELVACYLDCLAKANNKRKLLYFRSWRASFLYLRLKRARNYRCMRSSLNHWADVCSYNSTWISRRYCAKVLLKSFDRFRRNVSRRVRARENFRIALYSSYVHKKITRAKFQSFYAWLRLSRIRKGSKSIVKDHIERQNRIERLVDNIQKLKVAESKQYIASKPDQPMKKVTEKRRGNSSMQRKDGFTHDDFPLKSIRKGLASDLVSDSKIALRNNQDYHSNNLEKDILVVPSPTRRGSSSGFLFQEHKESSSSEDEDSVLPPSYADILSQEIYSKACSSDGVNRNKDNKEEVSDIPFKSRIERQRELRRIAEEKLASKRANDRQRQR